MGRKRGPSVKPLDVVQLATAVHLLTDVLRRMLGADLADMPTVAQQLATVDQLAEDVFDQHAPATPDVNGAVV